MNATALATPSDTPDLTDTPGEACPIARPPLALLGSEPLRAAVELARHAIAPVPAVASRGDGHPVIVFPGLGSDGLALAPLRAFCSSLGYHTLDWGMGRNTGPRGDLDAWLDGLADHTRTLLGSTRRKASFIGWSLGGLYARELAKRMPQRVRQVITLGTPFNLHADPTHVGWVIERFGGPVLDAPLARRLREPPPVPTTSIYSRGDGVVAWEACRHGDGCTGAEDIEVDGSHLGMGGNASVMALVAERLARRRASRRDRAASASVRLSRPEN